MLDLLTYAGTLHQPGRAATPGCSSSTATSATPTPSPGLMAGADAVVHFAAESHVDRSIAGAADFVSTNCVGTQVLLARRARRRASTGSCTSPPTRSTARSTTGSWPESHPLEPNSPYSASKAGSDLIARAYHRTYGLPVVHHPLLQQLRALPVPGEGHPAVRHEPARRRARSRSTATGSTCATGCTSTTTAAASSSCSTKGRAGRDLQHRRRHRADQPRAHRPAARRASARARR